jgi:hypothetical protein
MNFTIQCPFCTLKLRSQNRHPNEVAQSLANHLRHYHRLVGDEE